MLTVGLVMAPQGLVMMAMSPLSAAISKAKGPKVTLMLGALIVAAGYGLNIVLMSEVWHLVLVSCIIGAGIGLTYGAMPALIMGAVPASETAAANSLNTLMRSIGTSFASAVAGVVLAQMTTDFGGYALPVRERLQGRHGHRRRCRAARAGPRLVHPPRRRRGTGARGRAGRGREGLPARVTPHPAHCARCEQFVLCSGRDPRGGHRE